MDPMTTLEDEYDRILRERRGEVSDYVEGRRDALARHGIDVGDFHLPLRPLLLSPERRRHLERCVEAFWGALLKTFFLEFAGEVRRIAGLLQLAEPVVECLERYFTPERELAQLYGRPDGFAWDSQVRFIEQNVTSGPGGLASIHALTYFFDEFPVIRALRERAPIAPFSPIDAYLALFRSPRFAAKRIGYIDALAPTGGLWDDDGQRFLAALAERDVELVDLTGRALELRDNGLHADGERIDVVYRGVAAVGLWFRGEELLPIYQACGRGQAEMIISPYEMVLFDKMLLPYLSDPRLGDFLSSEDRALLAEILPWTRFLREGPTLRAGGTVALPAFCFEAKDDLVIKKGNGFGSEAVVMGCESTEGAWRTHVEQALAEGNWIVQELVSPPRRSLPYLDRGELHWADAVSMACPYVVAGRVCGVASRTSVPGGGRILVGAGAPGGQAGIRTSLLVG